MRRIYDDLANFVGIRRSTIDSPGTGRRLKRFYDDFIVEEITPEGDLISIDEPKINCYHRGKGYTRAALIKRGRETHEAIRMIARSLKIPMSYIGFAGTKDKRAATAQRISIKGNIIDLELPKGLELRSMTPCGAPIRLGELWGNRFTITMRDGSWTDESWEELVSKGFINYYGFQRFGANRPISHMIGKALILGDIEKAFDLYIAAEFYGLPENLVQEPKEASVARELYYGGKIKEALDMFPDSFSYEKRLLSCLLKKNDKAWCFSKVFPRRLYMMFIHAFQAYVWNETLSRAIDREERIPQRWPLPGFRTRVHLAKDLLKGIPGSAWRRNRLPGGWRETIRRLDTPQLLNIKSNEVHLRFSLRRGSYASVALFEAFEARE